MPIQPLIEGTSADQRALLVEIIHGLGPTEITRIEVRRYLPRGEDDVERAPGHPHANEIHIEFPLTSQRSRWEAQLVAQSFASRSRGAGLMRVAWLSLPKGEGWTIELPGDRPKSVDAAAIENARRTISAAGGDAVQRIDVLQPDMWAVAITLRADESHAFFRRRLRLLLRVAEENLMPLLGGLYVEVRDREAAPAFTLGRFRYGGMGAVRPDLECCAGAIGFGGGGIDAPAPPPCPVFG